MGWRLGAGVILAGAAVSAPVVAYCHTYLTEDQSLKAIFPGETFIKKSVALTSEEIRKIEEKSGQKVRATNVPVWVSSNGDLIFIDQVLGKHEFITYAIGVTKDGHVKSIEILEYRETYGQEVAGESWRKQFVDKTASAPLKIDDDIKNISGATLSSVHITAGVKRVLQTYDNIHARI